MLLTLGLTFGIVLLGGMAIQQFYQGSVGPSQYDDDDVYADGEDQRSFRGANAQLSAGGGTASGAADNVYFDDNGIHIVVSANDRTSVSVYDNITFEDDTGVVIAQIFAFYNTGDARMKFYIVDADDVIVEGGTITLNSGELHVNYDNLPTSDPAIKGQLYRDSLNNLAVSAG